MNEGTRLTSTVEMLQRMVAILLLPMQAAKRVTLEGIYNVFKKLRLNITEREQPLMSDALAHTGNSSSPIVIAVIVIAVIWIAVVAIFRGRR